MSLSEVRALFDTMPRVDALWSHPRFQELLGAVENAEVQRPWCKHGLAHLLDVARLMWIAALEHNVPLPRDVVYAAALLHDIGRAAQYATGEDHHLASSRIADEILGTVEDGYAFSVEEQQMILAAVASHGRAGCAGDLERLLYAADKASRACFACTARATCTWPKEKKNLAVRA